MGTSPVVPNLETESLVEMDAGDAQARRNHAANNIGQSEAAEMIAAKTLWPDAKNDAGEYESKFLATSQLLEEVTADRDLLIRTTATMLDVRDRKLALALAELGQYGSDLRMWVAAHASEYPARRARELTAKMNEIEAVK